MNILSWLLFGLIVGLIASALDAKREGSLPGSVLLGVGGALLGGFLANLLFDFRLGGFSLSAFLVATVGSLIILALGRRMIRV